MQSNESEHFREQQVSGVADTRDQLCALKQPQRQPQTISWSRVSVASIFSGAVLLPLGGLVGYAMASPPDREIGVVLLAAMFFLAAAFVLNRLRKGPASLIILAGALATVVAVGGTMRSQGLGVLSAAAICALVGCIFLLHEAAQAQRHKSVPASRLGWLLFITLGIAAMSGWVASTSAYFYSPRSVASAAEIADLDPRVEDVAFFGVGDAQLALLKEAPKLHTAQFVDCIDLTAGGMSMLVEHTDLRTLAMVSCDVDDAALAALARAPHLERVCLMDCAMVTASGVENLARVPGMRELLIRECPNVSLDRLLLLRRHYPDVLFNVLVT